MSEETIQNLECYLEDRVAIITGGFSGIRLSIAEALSLRGAAVALGGRTVRDTAADSVGCQPKAITLRQGETSRDKLIESDGPTEIPSEFSITRS